MLSFGKSIMTKHVGRWLVSGQDFPSTSHPLFPLRAMAHTGPFQSVRLSKHLRFQTFRPHAFLRPSQPFSSAPCEALSGFPPNQSRASAHHFMMYPYDAFLTSEYILLTPCFLALYCGLNHSIKPHFVHILPPTPT